MLKKSGIVNTGGRRFLVPMDGVVIRLQHFRVRKYMDSKEPSWWSTLTGIKRERRLVHELESISATFLPSNISGSEQKFARRWSGAVLAHSAELCAYLFIGVVLVSMDEDIAPRRWRPPPERSGGRAC